MEGAQYLYNLPEVYQNPPEERSLPIVAGTSAIGVLPLLFLLLFFLCLCCCGGQHGSRDNETKSQLDFNSSNPGMDFSEENPDGVSVHLPPEEDRQTDMQADSFTTARRGKPQSSFWSSPKTREYRSLVSRQEILGYERWDISCRISKQRASQSRAMTATTAAELVSPEGTRKERTRPSSSRQTAATLRVSPERARDVKTAGSWPQTAEARIGAMIPASPDASIFPYVEKR
ncbi:uncharacterized protein [Ovis canadensis]|uniref:uncharacterized protein isoform X1 n=1 Tax=Ovis canadensis TaxID=37174 RepID=UPI003753A572